MELELVVVKKEAPKMFETNISDLERYVDERLKEFEPETFDGDVSRLKKARAELNKAKSQLKEKRKSLLDEWMKPFSELENRLKVLEEKIDSCSEACSSIVKNHEAVEKEEKRGLIERIFNGLQISFVTLDKIFNPKWLNKSYSVVEIEKEIRGTVMKVGNELGSLEEMFQGETLSFLRSYYLDCLDFSDTVAKGKSIQEKTAVAENVAGETETLRRDVGLAEQKKEIHDDLKHLESEDAVKDIAAAALEMDGEPERHDKMKEYAVSFKCTERQSIAVKNFLTMQGIVFDSFEEIRF